MQVKKMKVLLVASHGGHWVQLRKIASAFDDMHTQYLSITKDIAHEVSSSRLFVVKDANLKNKYALLVLALSVLRIIISERPNVIISTGAAPGYFSLMFGKVFGAKTVWVDSIANAEQLSVSGQKVGKFADLWLTQWPHLARKNGPYYRGGVL